MSGEWGGCPKIVFFGGGRDERNIIDCEPLGLHGGATWTGIPPSEGSEQASFGRVSALGLC